MSLSLVNLSKSFAGGHAAVRDVSLDVREGELLVVLGPSGCGKTTLLRLIAGLEKPSAGDVMIAGKRATHLRPAQRSVGFIFQQPVLYPHMTVERNLAFVLRRTRLTKAEKKQRIERVVQLCKINAMLKRKPSAISVGEQQRVALARGVLRQPKCLLLDEPLASLDAPLRLKLRREIRNVHNASKLTSIFVTHDQQEAFALADRVALMKAGVIQQIATPMALYQAPANTFAAKFIGSPGMNLMNGHIEQRDGKTQFVSGSEICITLSNAPAITPMQKTTLGIRPEHIVIHNATSHQPMAEESFDVSIALVEAFGDHAILHARTRDNQSLIIKSHACDNPKPGDSRRASFNPGALHFFEPDPGGRRIATS